MPSLTVYALLVMYFTFQLNEKIQDLEKDKKSLADEVCDLKKEVKI